MNVNFNLYKLEIILQILSFSKWTPSLLVLLINRDIRVMTWKKMVKIRGLKGKQEKLKCHPVKALKYLIPVSTAT